MYIKLSYLKFIGRNVGNLMVWGFLVANGPTSLFSLIHNNNFSQKIEKELHKHRDI
jgi:hypothetical protein